MPEPYIIPPYRDVSPNQARLRRFTAWWTSSHPNPDVRSAEPEPEGE